MIVCKSPIIVCGGRTYANREHVFCVLDSINGNNSLGHVSVVIHGDAPGADTLADQWARERGILVKPYPADWQKHGRRAGPIRNRQMIRDNPSCRHLVAFPGGDGTKDMMHAAADAGLEVCQYHPNGTESYLWSSR